MARTGCRGSTGIVLLFCLLLPTALLAQVRGDAASHPDSIQSELERLERRVEELEKAKAAQEDATRAIIRQTISESESKINKFVTFGGTFEQVGGWAEDFGGATERVMRLNTAELDFEIQVNDWTLGSLIFEYDDGTDTLFQTIEGREAAVDRINVDTAFITLGDTQKFVPYATFGRMIVPFGISTGDPVADVLTLEDPLTVEIFETREDALLIGFGFPTPPQPKLSLGPAPPRVRPRALNPLFGKISRALGYRPPPPTPPPTAPVLTTPAPSPPLFNLGVYLYDGNTFNSLPREDWHPEDHIGLTAGFRTKGPWSVDVDVDFNNSVFDSRFLEVEYRGFLDRIGLVAGMAASVKANLGRVPFLVEWNGAIEDAVFRDDLGRAVTIRPSAWQVSLGYQFDWNPWVEALGSQGTYLALGYSESRDLAGVTRLIDDEEVRVGAVPERRFLVSAGEWIWDGVRVAVEYSHVVDYSKSEGGTGNSANGIFSMLTYEW